MVFLLNFVGLIVFIAGLAWLATSLGVAQAPVAIAALVLFVVGVGAAVARLRADKRS